MKEKIYNITICILCFASVGLAVIDFTQGLTDMQRLVDDIIYVIFVVDYIVRFAIAADKKKFFKENIFDLIAIIPFNSTFRIFRTLKFSKFLKFAKLFKLLRVGSVLARMLSKAKRFLNTNGLKYVLILSLASILFATIGIMYFEHMQFEDALWWAFVTATTVGYGDLSPSTKAGRVIASLLMLVGIGVIGSLTSSITSFFLHPHEKPEKPSSDKVEMVMTMYNSLSDEEKQEFKEELMH